MSARSRSPTGLEQSMLSRSVRASSASSTGVLPRLTTCFGPRTAAGRVHLDHLAHDEPVEEHADGREMLLGSGRAVALAEQLDVAGDVMGAERLQGERASIAPGAERAHGERVSGARIAVADLRGEE